MRSNKWFTLSEASATLNISLSTLRRHIDKGKYKTKTEQGRRLVKLTETHSESHNELHNETQMKFTETHNEAHVDTSELHKQLNSEIQFLREQNIKLTDEISEARTRSDTIIMQLTQQLERTQMQLEDLRETKTLWQRVRSVFIPNSA
jgi:polyhydroxyalkanoate synthesis regulator phasin